MSPTLLTGCGHNILILVYKAAQNPTVSPPQSAGPSTGFSKPLVFRGGACSSLLCLWGGGPGFSRCPSSSFQGCRPLGLPSPHSHRFPFLDTFAFVHPEFRQTVTFFEAVNQLIDGFHCHSACPSQSPFPCQVPQWPRLHLQCSPCRSEC